MVDPYRAAWKGACFIACLKRHQQHTHRSCASTCAMTGKPLAATSPQQYGRRRCMCPHARPSLGAAWEGACFIAPCISGNSIDHHARPCRAGMSCRAARGGLAHAPGAASAPKIVHREGPAPGTRAMCANAHALRAMAACRLRLGSGIAAQRHVAPRAHAVPAPLPSMQCCTCAVPWEVTVQALHPPWPHALHGGQYVLHGLVAVVVFTTTTAPHSGSNSLL